MSVFYDSKQKIFMNVLCCNVFIDHLLGYFDLKIVEFYKTEWIEI